MGAYQATAISVLETDLYSSTGPFPGCQIGAVQALAQGIRHGKIGWQHPRQRREQAVVEVKARRDQQDQPAEQTVGKART